MSGHPPNPLCVFFRGQWFLSLMVRAWWTAAKETALAVSRTAWILYHCASKGRRWSSLRGCGLKNSFGFRNRSTYAVAAAPTAELVAATTREALVRGRFQPARRAPKAAGVLSGAIGT